MRIVVASRDSFVRSALGILFRAQDDLTLVGDATDASDLRSMLNTRSPDLVIVDLDGFGSPFEESFAVVRGLDKLPRVFGISVRPEDRASVLDSGADGFVYKGDPPEHLLAAIRSTGSANDVSRQDGANSKNERTTFGGPR